MGSQVSGKIICSLLAGFFVLMSAQAGFAARTAKAGKTSSPAAAGPGQPSIKIGESVFNFGHEQEGKEISHDFIVRNVGGGILNIDRIRVG